MKPKPDMLVAHGAPVVQPVSKTASAAPNVVVAQRGQAQGVAARPAATVASPADAIVIQDRAGSLAQRTQHEANRGRLAAVVEDSNDAITIQNLDGQITAWNRGAASMYGYTEAEALLMNIRDTVPEDRREQALDLLRQAETGQVVASLETQRRTKDGRILDVWLTTTKLLGEQGKITAIATTERDITQRKKEDGQLRRLASVVRDSNDAITVQDLEGRFEAWNKGAERMYGYTESEALKMNNSQLVPAAERARALDLVRQIRTGEAVDSLELQRVTKDGRTLDVWLTITKLLDNQQKIVGFATTERDVTKRRKEESSLRRLASVVLDSNDAITVQDLEGRFEAWNKGAEGMYGYTESEALKMNNSQLVPAAERARALDLVRQIRTGEPVDSLELQRVTKDGRTLDVWLTITKLLDEQKNVVGFATTERDVTQRKQQEANRGRLASVVADSNDAITIQNLDGKITAWNKGAQSMYGYTEAEALQMNIRDTVPEDRREQALDLLRQAETGQVVASLETQRRTKAGLILDVWLTTTKLLNEQGKIVAIATTERDITQRKLQEANRGRLASVVADSNDAITIQNLDGKITAWNKGAQSMYGYAEAEALQMNIRDTVPDNRREQALDLLRQAETGELVASLETQRLSKDGRILDVWLTTTKLVDEQGKIVAIATTERDITQRKQDEANRGRLASVVADSNDAIIIQDLDGKITAWNKGAHAMYGYTEAEALGTNNSQLVPTAERARASDLVRQIRTGEPVESLELQRVTKDGRTLDVWLTITKLLDDQQKVVGFATTERDITERKQQEANRGRLASVVADSNDAITIQNLDGKITAWNKGAQTMYGYTEAEALQMNIRDTVPEDRREQALDLLRQAETGKVVESLETQRLSKDGRILDVWLTTTKLLDEQGKIVAIATTERDVTVLRAAEKERREAHERVQEVGRLQEVNRFKTQFINTAAHELWTPLMPLRTQVHLLINSPTNPPTASQKKALGVMERNLERLGTLVEDLLTAARSQAGRQGIEPQPMDLAQVLVEAAEAYEDMAKNRGIELTVPHDGDVAIVADSKRISQVLANLLSNAFKFTPKGGRIGLELKDEGATVLVSVKDSGMGIAKLDLPRLFSPFVQVHDTAEVTAPGSGLGLFICKEFIELHGGTIGALSPGKGEGSTFWFTLPKTGVRPNPATEPGASAGEWTSDPPSTSIEPNAPPPSEKFR